LCSDCYIKDKESGSSGGNTEELLDKLVKALSSKVPVFYQDEYIRNLARVIYAIELILPYWGDAHRMLKLSLEQHIAEFHDECEKARLSSKPNPNPESALYTTLYHIIIRELIDEKTGESVDWIDGLPRP
jgi:hypothetical protein